MPTLPRTFQLAALLCVAGLCAACESTTDVQPTPSGAGGDGGCVEDSDCGELPEACRAPACEDGVCVHAPLPDGNVCDDGAYCTDGDHCEGGECVPGLPRDCSDPSGCQITECDEAAASCVGVPVDDGTACDGGDPCTQGGTCHSGVCTGGKTIDCSSLNGPCTVGLCDATGQCVAGPANEGIDCPFGDGMVCSGGVCAAGLCISAPAPDGTPCDDAQHCTTNDTCAAGVCTGAEPLECASPGGCFVGACDDVSDSCVVVPGNDGSPCDDGSLCTSSSVCASGACVGEIPANDGAACDDGASCTANTTCSAGACGGGTGPTVYFADTFADASKGWLLDKEWEIGPAEASSGGTFGDDPAQDHTTTADEGVAGVVLGGLASTSVHPARYLESTTFDTSQAAGPVVLSFYRWLVSDNQPYMTNYLDAWDGSAWVNVWTSGAVAIIDNAWTYVEHDLTAYKSATMRVRFGVSVDNGGVYAVSSWNIDDVVVASASCP